MPNCREVPSRDEKYMGLAWIHAGFSKDPHTQVGAQIVSSNNIPLGSGYNGPPAVIDDEAIDWARNADQKYRLLTKYDLIMHAEHNAIKHCRGADLTNATIYVTALPCPRCMLEIAEQRIGRVVYFEFSSDKQSSLSNDELRKKTFKIADMAKIRMDRFSGSVAWIWDWSLNLEKRGIFDVNSVLFGKAD